MGRRWLWRLAEEGEEQVAVDGGELVAADSEKLIEEEDVIPLIGVQGEEEEGGVEEDPYEVEMREFNKSAIQCLIALRSRNANTRIHEVVNRKLLNGGHF